MIEVDENLCKGCSICVAFCRRNVYEMSNKLDKKGVHLPAPVNEEECRKCKICAIFCPELAITVIEEE